MKNIVSEIKYYYDKILEYFYFLFVLGNNVLYTLLSLVLFSSFFVLFFEIVNIDKQIEYKTIYISNYIFDKAKIFSNSNDVSYIDGINKTFQASKESPEIVIYTDKNEITDINSQTNKIFNDRGIGSAEYNNGVLVYVNTTPSPKLRVEVGYGLEDVINDAKAGRIIDDNIAKVNNKPLAEYNNDELSKLLPLIFNDIAAIVADKYKIDISQIDGTNISNILEYEKHIRVDYSIKDVEPYLIYLFILTAVLLFIIIIMSNFAYALFIISLFAVAGYAVYLYESIVVVMFAVIFYILPFIVSSWSEKGYNRTGYIRDFHSFLELFTYSGYSYFTIASRFVFVAGFVFTAIYFLLIKAFVLYGFGTIIFIVAIIVFILSLLLMQYRQAYVVMLLYSFSLSLLLGSYILFGNHLYLLFYLISPLSFLIGYSIYENVLGIPHKHLTFFTIFEITFLSILSIIMHSSSKGGRSRSRSFRVGGSSGRRSGGGRSGGGGARR